MSAYRDPRDGRWRYRKRIRLADGRRVRITGTPSTNTKAAAEGAERDHILRTVNPAAVAAPTAKEVPTVRQFSKTWIAARAADKPSERASKEQILAGAVLPHFGGMRLDEITQADVDGFIAAQLASVSRKTLNNRLAVLSSLVRYAVRNRLIADPGLSCHIKTGDAELVAVARADVMQMTACADDRLAAAVLLAYQAGLRVGEVRGLQWCDLDELRGEITVRRAFDPRNHLDDTKNRRSRPIPVAEQLREALRALRGRGTWVIARRDGGPLGYYTLRDQLRALYTAAGVTIPPKPWHCLRHSFCSELAAAGVPINVIKELAGHASITTTLRYMHAGAGARHDAIAKAFGQHAGNEPDAETRKPEKP